MLVNSIVGSTLYGLNTHGSDEDTMGIFIFSPEQKLGLGSNDTIGGSDHTLHELTKFVRLAAKGNPTVTELLWAPENMWLQWDQRWEQWRMEIIDLTTSQNAINAYLGYSKQQQKNLISGHSQRKELIEQYGYDTKTAMHMLRLLFQCQRYLQCGKLTFPLDPYERDVLLDVRNGKYSEEYVVEAAQGLEHQLRHTESPLPKDVDYEKINKWLAHVYKEYWGWCN